MVAVKLGWGSSARERLISFPGHIHRHSCNTHPPPPTTNTHARTHAMEKDPSRKKAAGKTSYSFKTPLQMHTHTPLSSDSSPPLAAAATEQLLHPSRCWLL